MKHTGRVLVLFLALTCLVPVVFGQITATIHGVVRDSQGAVLPNVTVTVESPALKRGTLDVTTDDQGRYRVAGLQPGVYTLTAELASFQRELVEGTELALNTDVQVDITLRLAGVQEAVTVTADVSLLRESQSDLQALIDNRTINAIPLNGRQFLDLMKLVPGTAPRDPLIDQGADVTVFGERATSNSFLVDGLDNNNPFSRSFAEFFIQDAIQEFEVLLGGYQAEFGRATGAVANVVTRSGTNDFHGSVFGYFRDDALDSSNIEGQEAPALERQEFGGTLGGPIARDRTYFFGAFQLFREKRGIIFDQSILPQIVRDGYFSPALGTEPFDETPLDRRITSFFKLNHTFNRKNQLSVTFNLNRGINDFLIPSGTGERSGGPPPPIFLPSSASDLELDSTSVNGRYTTFFGDTAFLESSLRFNRIRFGENLEKIQSEEVFAPITHVPDFVVWLSGASVLRTVDRTTDQFQWVESLSYFKDTDSLGSHSFKLGIDYLRNELDHFIVFSDFIILGNTALDVEGRYEELGYDISMQRADKGLEEIVGPNKRAQGTVNNWALFLQDSWSVTPGFTLNLGVRYDYSSLLSDDKNNFGPRLGFAYDVGNRGKTVIRGSLGRFYDSNVLEAIARTPELGGISNQEFDFQIIPRGGAFYNNPSIGAWGVLQDSGTRWLSNPNLYSYLIPEGDVRTSGNLTITGRGEPYIMYELLGIPVNDPATPPVLNFASIPELTGGRLTPEEALAILNGFFPGPECDQFEFLRETGENSVNLGRPLIFKFRNCEPEIVRIQTLGEQKLPHTDSFNIGIEQALGEDLSLEAQLFVRRTRDLMTLRVTNLLEVPVAASCKGNTVDGSPCNAQLEPIGFLDTNAFVLSLVKRFSDGYAFAANYTYTDATDNLTNPRIPTVFGESSFLLNNFPERDIGRSLNTPEHVFVFSGLSKLPYGIDLSGVLRAMSGRPFNAAGLPLDSDGDSLFDTRLLGTEKGGFTTGHFFNIDVRFAKEFHLGEDARLLGLVEIFNLTNRLNPLQVFNVCQDSTGDGLPDPAGCGGGRFGDAVTGSPGREVQIGVRFEF